MFEDLITKVDEKLSSKPHVTVAISGFGGAGKSTLAERLGKHYGVKQSQIVQLDNLFVEPPYGPGIFDDYDWPLINKIIQKVREGKRLRYQGRGFLGERPLFDEPLPKVVIFEGVRLLRPEIISNFDVTVWVDCPHDLALKRGKERDRLQGADEAHISRWDTEWGPLDDKYFDSYRPDKLATFLYQEYK